MTENDCPVNKVWDTCKCEGSCADPSCNKTCSGTPSCVCPDGFLMLKDECVPQRDCGCYMKDEQTGTETVIPVK